MLLTAMVKRGSPRRLLQRRGKGGAHLAATGVDPAPPLVPGNQPGL